MRLGKGYDTQLSFGVELVLAAESGLISTSILTSFVETMNMELQQAKLKFYL